MSEDKVITLGGKDFPIAPLTLGQMKQAGPAFSRIGYDTPEAVSAQITFIYLAMHSADPKVTPADVDAIVGVTVAELNKAVTKVGLLTGFLIKVDAPGEAQPAQPAAASTTSTGSKSTAA